MQSAFPGIDAVSQSHTHDAKVYPLSIFTLYWSILFYASFLQLFFIFFFFSFFDININSSMNKFN